MLEYKVAVNQIEVIVRQVTEIFRVRCQKFAGQILAVQFSRPGKHGFGYVDTQALVEVSCHGSGYTSQTTAEIEGTPTFSRMTKVLCHAHDTFEIHVAGMEEFLNVPSTEFALRVG